MKRKSFIGMMALALALPTLCSTAVTAEELAVVGTGSGMAILESIGKAFNGKNAGMTVSVPKSIGSDGGIKAVGTDQAAIGRVSRKIKENEKSYELVYMPIAKMPIAFFVNKSVETQNLSADQVCAIYSGKINEWSEVGGKSAKLRVVRREDSDSSLKVLLEQFPGFKEIALTAKSKTTNKDSENCEFIEKTTDTIGFGPYDMARNYQVNILKIDGKHPSDPGYAFVGELALIYKEKNFKENIKKFVGFAKSAEAHEAIKSAGGLPY
ncbi:MAG: phosphate ABC transporter substrate-binding protein [Desulfobacteraceae bacterium]|nr:MAG: phosphate ABC transporter substrate-binding protein [Desulfobacteraceae bacterium]